MPNAKIKVKMFGNLRSWSTETWYTAVRQAKKTSSRISDLKKGSRGSAPKNYWRCWSDKETATCDRVAHAAAPLSLAVDQSSLRNCPIRF
jgi:hypothetical protein